MRWFAALLCGAFLLSGCTERLATPELDYSKISDEIVVLGDLQNGHGSGVIVSSDGLILTNAHVAEHVDSDNTMQVQFHDGSVGRAHLLWTTGSVVQDVALFKIDGSKTYPFAKIGTEKLYVGQPVFAIGNPEFLGWSITWGHISVVDRDLSPMGGGEEFQVDLSISPGSSGGGLFDSDGNLIGMTNASLTDNHMMSFAVSRDTITSILEQHLVVVGI